MRDLTIVDGPEAAADVLLVHGYGLEGSGSSIYTRNFATHLARHGHRVRLMCFRHEGDGRAFDALSSAGVEVVPVDRSCLAVAYYRPELPGAPLCTELSVGALAVTIEAWEHGISTQLRRRPADTVITNHLLLASAAAVRVARHAGLRSVVISHGTDIEYAAARSHQLAELARSTVRAAGRCVALTETARSRAAQVLGVERTEFQLVSPGVDLPCATQPDNDNDRHRHVVQVGRLLLDKGPHVTIGALAHLVHEGHDARLTLAGAGPDEPLLRQWVRALHEGDERASLAALDALAGEDREHRVAPVRSALHGAGGAELRAALRGQIGDRVRFAGYLAPSELSELLSGARVCVLPSLIAECYPLSLVEAMTAGCLVAATDLGGSGDILRWAENLDPAVDGRFRVDPSSPTRSLAAAIRAGMSLWTPERVGRLAQAARRCHDWGNVTETLLRSARRRRRTESAQYYGPYSDLQKAVGEH